MKNKKTEKIKDIYIYFTACILCALSPVAAYFISEAVSDISVTAKDIIFTVPIIAGFLFAVVFPFKIKYKK